MSAALEILFLLGIGFLYFQGLGCLPFILLQALNSRTENRWKVQLPETSTLLAFGLSTNYALVMILRSFPYAMPAGLVASVAGWIGAFFCCEKRIYRLSPATLWAVVVSGTLAIVTIRYPIAAWDARSVWFLHAKMMYYERAEDPSLWLLHPPYLAHFDYPKLIPVLAAQIAFVAGFWNEYLPKLSLTFVLLPAIFFLSNLKYRPISLSMLWACLFFGQGAWLWNGMMDGLLAVYAGLGVLCLAVRDRGPGARWACLAGIIGLAASLKNEGILISVLFSACALLCIQKAWRRHFAVLLTWACAGSFAWSITKLCWGIRNDLPQGDALLRLSSRLFEPDFWSALSYYFARDNVACWYAAVIAAILATAKMKRLDARPAILASAVSVILLSAVSVVYLITPHDAVWHMEMSISRALMPTKAILVALSASLIQALEEPERRNG